MPPSEASAPGSIGKNKPLSRRCSLSCLRVTPGSTTQSRSSALTARTLFMRERSSETPPCGALTWPSSDEPIPKGTIGASWRAQSLVRSITSSLVSANTTASGGSFLSQVSVWPCALQIASEAVKRLPKRAARSELSAATASLERRPWRWRTESWVNGLSLWFEAVRLVALAYYCQRRGLHGPLRERWAEQSPRLVCSRRHRNHIDRMFKPEEAPRDRDRPSHCRGERD